MPWPTDSTTPAASLCGMTRGNGIGDPSQPRRFFVSPGFTPDLDTRTRTSPGPGSGAASSPNCSTPAAIPCRSYQTARTSPSLASGQVPDIVSRQAARVLPAPRHASNRTAQVEHVATQCDSNKLLTSTVFLSHDGPGRQA